MKRTYRTDKMGSPVPKMLFMTSCIIRSNDTAHARCQFCIQKAHCYNSAAIYPISMKLGRLVWIFTLRMVTWPKIKISQMQDGGRTPSRKSFFSYILAPYCPIIAKFGKMKQNARSHGGAENSSMEIVSTRGGKRKYGKGQYRLQGWKSQVWKRQVQTTIVEISSMENASTSRKVGKRRYGENCECKPSLKHV